MQNIAQLEEYYQTFASNLASHLPEGIIPLNLRLLQHLDLLHFNDPYYEEPKMSHYSHVVESYEKIMLLSEKFVIWIIPQRNSTVSGTLCLIALNHEEGPTLEIGILATGVYNSSKLILRAVEKYLIEIQETEDLLTRLG